MGNFLIILFDSRTGVIVKDTFRDPKEGLQWLYKYHFSKKKWKMLTNDFRVLFKYLRTSKKFYIENYVLRLLHMFNLYL